MQSLMQKIFTTSAILTSALVLSACQTTPPKASPPAEVKPTLKSQIFAFDQKNTKLGNMYLRPVADGVQVFGKLSGFQPGTTVSVHIHETGNCSNMGKAAGGHFNPFNKPHGNPDSAESHAGDLPNVTADAYGVASMNFVNKDISVDMTGNNSVYKRAFIVHAGTDDYVSQPSGNSGDRIACGVIEKF